jgi:pilus assembly protein CpaE
MDKDTTVLLIDENPAAIDFIRRALGEHTNRFRLRRVADVPTALARIWGGGVGLALLNLPPTGSCGDRLAPFLTLQEKAPAVPIVFLCASADEDLAKAAVRAGAADYLIRETVDFDLLRVLRSASGKAPFAATPSFSSPPARKGGKIIVFMGSKGGVGATTAAMNGASALARDRNTQHRPVILADLHAELGSLPLYFHPHRSIRDIGDLLHAESNSEEIPLAELESCLWPVKAVPGLQVLFGPRSPEHSSLLTPTNAARVLVRAAEIADYVIVDLPVSLSDTCRAVLENSDCLALVVERDPISVQAAKLILSRIDSWKAGKLTIGAVILNRAGLVSPMSFAEIDAELHIATLGVIPPACDLCAAAQHARTPMVALDTESIASIAMRNLGREIEDLVPAVRRAEHVEEGPLPAYAAAARKTTRAGLR